MNEQLIANCLHLEHRTDREQSILQQALQQGMYLRFWEGIVNRHNRKEGICRGHKQIIRDAKENGYKYCVVIEDDALFFGAGAWDYFLESMPDDFDIYFSMIYVGEITNNRITSLFSGMTCYIVAERFYDFFLNGIPDDCHLDRELGKHSAQFKFMVCDKFICEQMDNNKSDNTLTTTVSYRPFLKGRKIFGDVEID